jgi:hypothetical protein
MNTFTPSCTSSHSDHINSTLTSDDLECNRSVHTDNHSENQMHP